jgi:hypothetical protein
MSSFRAGNLVAWILFVVCGLALGLAGCSEKSHGTPVVNLPPSTSISFGPKEESRTYYKVQIYWYGTDTDGTIDHYEIALAKGISKGGDLDLNTLVWTPTARTESSFVVAADESLTQVGNAQYALSNWGVFVRAVDNEGLADTNPASLFFEASNAVPRAKITIPHKTPGINNLMPPHVYLEWRGEDSDGDASKIQYKYLLLPESQVRGGVWPPASGTPHPWLPDMEEASWEDSLGRHASPPVGLWSKWVPSDCTYVKDLNLSNYAGSGQKVMAFVTCKDEGHSVLPEGLFEPYDNGNNWVRLLIIRQGSGVATVVDAGPLGQRNSVARTGSIGWETNIAGLFVGTPISFKFWATEDRTQGKLASAYRYYFDDQDDPATSTWNYWTSVEPIRERGSGSVEWTVKFPPDGSRFLPEIGRRRFVVEIRDLNQDPTYCEFRLDVLPGPKDKPNLVFLVNDENAKWLENPYINYEQDNDVFWADVLSGYNWESWKTHTGSGHSTRYDNDVPIRRIGDATTVIWVVDQDLEGSETQLLRVCAYRGNYLNSYVKVGGNLIIIGRDPVFTTMYWPDGFLDPTKRNQPTNLDFAPRTSSVDSSLIYNFMWEAFGISKMASGAPPIQFKTLTPCSQDGLPTIQTDLIPGVESWLGRVDNAFYITQVRSDVPVRKLYSVIPVNSQGVPTGPGRCENEGADPAVWLGAYVPGDGTRGGAAYIGIPAWFFDHGQVKELIRKLLDEFGEPRTQ